MTRSHRWALDIMKWISIADVTVGMIIILLPSSMTIAERFLMGGCAIIGGAMLLWVNRQLIKVVEKADNWEIQ